MTASSAVPADTAELLERVTAAEELANVLADRVGDLEAIVTVLLGDLKRRQASDQSWAGPGGHGPDRAFGSRPERHLKVAR